MSKCQNWFTFILSPLLYFSLNFQRSSFQLVQHIIYFYLFPFHSLQFILFSLAWQLQFGLPRVWQLGSRSECRVRRGVGWKSGWVVNPFQGNTRDEEGRPNTRKVNGTDWLDRGKRHKIKIIRSLAREPTRLSDGSIHRALVAPSIKAPIQNKNHHPERINYPSNKLHYDSVCN